MNSKEKQLEKKIESVIDFCMKEKLPITIIRSGNDANETYHAGNVMDMAVHLLYLEESIENEGCPVELAKAAAVISGGDASEICTCNNCKAKRAARHERSGDAVDTVDIEATLRKMFGE